MVDNKVKHLEMIENIIERMAKNSFQLKGWAMTLVTIGGALGTKDSDKRFAILAFVPIFVFWLLDSMYLQSERRYRALYREVTEKKEKEIDFNLDTNKVKYTGEEAKNICFLKCLFSFSEIMFYGALMLSFVVLLVILKVR